MRNVVLLLFLIMTISSNICAQHKLKEVMRKGNKVYVIAKCNDEPNYGDLIKNRIAEETDWNIARNLQDANFVLKVHSWSRPQVAGIVRDFYAIIEMPNGEFLWRSSMKYGAPTVFNNYDYTQASIKKLINEVLNKDAVKASNDPIKEIDKTGETTVSTEAYQQSQKDFFNAIDYYDTYEFSDALKALEKSIKKNPNNAYAYRLQAIIYYKKGKYKNTIEVIEKAMLLDPYNIDNDSIFLAAKLEKNERFMRGISLSLALSNTVNSVSSVFLNSKNIQYSNLDNVNDNQENGSTIGLQKEICSFCKGTGVSPTSKSVASFGSTSDVWCDVCHKWVSAGHGYHDKCPSCNGKGYRTKIGTK